MLRTLIQGPALISWGVWHAGRQKVATVNMRTGEGRAP